LTLEAPRDALLADARTDADRVIAQAEADAAAALAHARRAADELIAAASARGEADGRIEAALQAARENALARMEVLAARRGLYDELRQRARRAVLSLRDEPGYQELLERLAAAARRDLGDDAELEVDPADAGGVRARSGSRRVDYSLPALAQRCVDALGPGLRQLWN
jgi:vacuolar-type H+-ATPase subunit E/Vma4